MLYKSYGKTGKKVSAIGFGGMRFLPEDYKKDVALCSPLVLRAQELGINYFDTAPDYCDQLSESIYGDAFRQMTGEYYVSTKCGLWNATTADGCRRVLEESLTRMKLPKVTFYNMWCIKTMDEYKKMTQKGGIYEGALKAKEEGLIEHICCTTHCTGDDIATIVADGLFEGVTLGYNAVNFAYRRSGVEACHKANRAVIVMNPLGGGLIPDHPEFFSFIQKGGNDSLPVAALKFLIGQPEITVALPGIDTMAHLEEAVSAADNVPVVDQARLDAMSQQLTHSLNTMCTGCAYCDECPSEVPIPKLMDAYNESILAGGDPKPVFSRLSDHWAISADLAANCVECGRCEPLCTQKLPIVDRLKEITAWANA